MCYLCPKTFFLPHSLSHLLLKPRYNQITHSDPFSCQGIVLKNVFSFNTLKNIALQENSLNVQTVSLTLPFPAPAVPFYPVHT
jgi:hypothetical protein